ncbi:MAG: DNA polymerase III subunit gamma/tau, partial [Actinobacteria bacterium]|nr:DNA polymerase III subunit gamma/tau [Actinomycetota bacterium]
MAEPTFQSLYRRYRPQRFDEVRGQDHVTRALRNAVREARVSHAYLFSGPRGTGTTSTARIRAKALTCTNQPEGEPCGTCESCTAVQQGHSLDVHELDAASNNGVDAMKDLVSRAALGTPGRWKVYIVDEVHMLTTAASNALLKTLEEPPGHVVFVLATTDPQKVLPTIRSRTQHYEFRLLSGDVLASLLRDVNADAALGVPTEAIDLVVRRGKGSARDALSVLDQVAAAGDVEQDAPASEELAEALCDRNAGRALVAVAEACAAGRDPRRLAEELIEHLRNAFLVTMAPALVDLPDDAKARVEDQARRLGPAGLVRAMEEVGAAIAEMKEALDARISLEVALVRVARPDADVSPAALLERLER